jgi:hypothetical protein
MILKKYIWLPFLLFSLLWIANSCKEDNPVVPGKIELAGILVGKVELDLAGSNENVPVDSVITILFRSQLDTVSAKSGIVLQESDNTQPGYKMTFIENDITVKLILDEALEDQTSFVLILSSSIKGSEGEVFSGTQVSFSTVNGVLAIETITLNGIDFKPPNNPLNVDYESISLAVTFTEPIDTNGYKAYFNIAGNVPISVSVSDDLRTVGVNNLEDLDYYRKIFFSISNGLKSLDGYPFAGFNNYFYSSLDSTYKFPEITDEELLDLVQSQTLKYFFDYAHPVSGMIRERYGSGDLVTTGGSGFGVMALIVGMSRNFITREQGLLQYTKMVDFLETCDRYHGAWPHWINGTTGATIPFSSNDNGADLVETGFMVQGLITMRQFLDPSVPEELDLIDRTNVLINGVEWDWFTRNQNVLYWHWSPTVGWAMNMTISGYNEALIIYLLAASSTTHTIEPIVYHNGWAKNGGIINGKTFYGYYQPVGWDYGGPLFFAHYSFLGLDPRNLLDMYGNYWTQNVNHSLINWAYCADNPKNHMGYSDVCWGLTASDQPSGYGVHEPTNDNGTITPSAAVSSLPYSPEQSMDAIRHFYYILGDRLWGPYGFYDAFNVKENWWASSYLAIDQGPIICLIENHRSGLLWDLFMSSPGSATRVDKTWIQLLRTI